MQYEKKSRSGKEKKQEPDVMSKVNDYFHEGLACKLSRNEMTMFLRLYGLNHDGSLAELVDRIMIQISALVE